MVNFETWFGNWVIRYRWLLLFLTPLLVLLAATGGQHLQFTNNYRVFFSEDNPHLKAFENLENTYTKDDNVLFVITPKQGDLVSRQALEAVEWLTKEAWQIPYSIRVDSITNYQHTEAEEDDLVVIDLVENSTQLSTEELAKIRQIATSEPILYKRLISEDAQVSGVNVTIQFPGVDETREVPEVVSFSREIVSQMQQKFPGVDVRLNGMVLMNNAFSEMAFKDMATLVPLSFLIMLVVLLILFSINNPFAAKSSNLGSRTWAVIRSLFSSLPSTIATLIVIMLSILAAMGMGGHIGFPISPPSSTAPTMILTIAIADSVHILSSYQHQMQLGKDRKQAMAESLRINLQPVFLTSLTTAIGFLSMNFSDAPPFQHLGNFVAFGVIAAFVLSITFLPAMVTLLPGGAGTVRDASTHSLIDRLAELVIRRHRQLLVFMGGIAVVLILMVPRNELNDIFVHYFDETVQFRMDADYLDEHLGGLYRVDYSIPSGEKNGIADPDYLKKIQQLTNWLRDQPEVVHVNSISDVFTRLNKNMHADDPNWYKLPDQRDLAAQYLLLYEMSLPYGLDLNNQVTIDKSATRLSVTFRIMSTKAILMFEERVQNWFAQNAPDMQTAGTSPTIMFAHIGKRNIETMLVGTTVALILISAILVFAFRSLRIGAISLIPNLVPAAIGFGIWAVFVGEVGLALSVVTGMTLGIVVDDTVHFLSKYLRARREHQSDATEAVRYAFHSVGRALLITTIVLIAGFLVLSTSAFKLNAGMGLLTAIVIGTALIIDFFLLPPLLMKLDGDKK